MTPRRSASLPFLSVGLGIGAFSMMDAVMKSASIAAGVYNAVLLRSLSAALLMLPIWLVASRRRPAPAAMRLHIQRSLVVSVMALLFFFGLVRIPMAEAIAISFIAPLIALYLAAAFLGERIRPQAILSSLLGLAGVAVIAAARFGDGGLEPDSAIGMAAILVSAVLYAVNLVLQRKQAQLADPVEIAFFQNLLVGLVLATAAPWAASWPAPDALAEIFLGGLLATIALLFLAWGYARAEAQALIPIEYSGFLWAALFGWLWFGEQLRLATLAGASLIIVGCWIAATRPATSTAA